MRLRTPRRSTPATDTDGCDAGSLPLGTKVDVVEGGSPVSEGTRVGGGTLVYSSWLTMQQRNEAPTTTSPWWRSTPRTSRR